MKDLAHRHSSGAPAVHTAALERQYRLAYQLEQRVVVNARAIACKVVSPVITVLEAGETPSAWDTRVLRLTFGPHLRPDYVCT